MGLSRSYRDIAAEAQQRMREAAAKWQRRGP